MRALSLCLFVALASLHHVSAAPVKGEVGTLCKIAIEKENVAFSRFSQAALDLIIRHPSDIFIILGEMAEGFDQFDDQLKEILNGFVEESFNDEGQDEEEFEKLKWELNQQLDERMEALIQLFIDKFEKSPPKTPGSN